MAINMALAFAAINASTLLVRLPRHFLVCLWDFVSIQSNGALVRSGTDVGLECQARNHSKCIQWGRGQGFEQATGVLNSSNHVFMELALSDLSIRL